jgi:hypothetical protein
LYSRREFRICRQTCLPQAGKNLSCHRQIRLWRKIVSGAAEPRLCSLAGGCPRRLRRQNASELFSKLTTNIKTAQLGGFDIGGVCWTMSELSLSKIQTPIDASFLQNFLCRFYILKIYYAVLCAVPFFICD